MNAVSCETQIKVISSKIWCDKPHWGSVSEIDKYILRPNDFVTMCFSNKSIDNSIDIEAHTMIAQSSRHGPIQRIRANVKLFQ